MYFRALDALENVPPMEGNGGPFNGGPLNITSIDSQTSDLEVVPISDNLQESVYFGEPPIFPVPITDLSVTPKKREPRKRPNTPEKKRRSLLPSVSDE